jgi:hypothetical protein
MGRQHRKENQRTCIIDEVYVCDEHACYDSWMGQYLLHMMVSKWAGCGSSSSAT